MDKINRVTTENYLKSIAIPQLTNSYKPVSHRELIDTTKETLYKNNYKISSERYLMADDGQLMTGKFAINYGSDKDLALQVAFQNSYNKKVSLKFAIGIHVFVCSNSACVGDMGALRRKHTGDVQTFTPNFITEVIGETEQHFQRMIEQKKQFEEMELTKKVSAELIGRMFIDENLITSTQLNIIKREIENPSFNYNSKGSAWELYNHCTLACRDSHPLLWMKQHMDVHDFFSKNLLKLENA